MKKYLEQEVKRLALAYRDKEDPTIFKQILILVDELLKNLVKRMIRKKPYLQRMELQDLYHAAVIGLLKAVLKVKEEETGGILVSKIIYCVGDEISSWGKAPREKPFSSFLNVLDAEQWPPWVMGIWSGGDVKQLYYESTYNDIESSFIRDRFTKLIEEGILSLEDFDLLVMRIVNGMKYKDVAKQLGCSISGASIRVTAILNRLRYEFRLRGWDDVF